MEKRWVFNLDLNMSRVFAFLIARGRAFQRKGARCVNALPPMVILLKCVTSIRPAFWERSERTGVYRSTSLDI